MEVLDSKWTQTLGLKDISALSPGAVLENSGLNWTVEKRPLFVGETENHFDENGVTQTNVPTKQELDKYVATYRTDNEDILGIVSPNYEVFQNEELAELAWAIESEGTAEIETAGTFRDGRDVFLMMRNSSFTLPGEDKVDTYHFFYNSHDGSRTLTVMPTTIRVWCTNTMNAVLRQSTKGMKFRHSAGMKDAIEESLQILNVSQGKTEEFRKRCEVLAQTRIDEASGKMRSFFNHAYSAAVKPISEKRWGDCTEEEKREYEKRDDIVYEWNTNLGYEKERMNDGPLTLWNAFNAMTEWVDHERGTGKGRNMSRVNRFRSNIVGTNAKIKDKMFATTAALV